MIDSDRKEPRTALSGPFGQEGEESDGVRPAGHPDDERILTRERAEQNCGLRRRQRLGFGWFCRRRAQAQRARCRSRSTPWRTAFEAAG